MVSLIAATTGRRHSQKSNVHNLRMRQATGDFALFLHRCSDQLVALSGSYVDKVLQSSKPEIKKEIQRQLKEHFYITLSNAQSFLYTGIVVQSMCTPIFLSLIIAFINV